MALNIITAKFCSGSTQTWTDEAYQWDYGQVLQFDGLNLPDAYQVHFSNTPMTGETITQIGGADGVTVPDQYFTTGETIYAWVYLHEGEDDGETVYMVTIPVKKRPQPSDDVPTPVEQSAIDQAIAALNIAVEKAEDAIEHYPTIIDGTWHVWDVTEEEYVDTGVKAQGEQGDPGDPGDDGFSPEVTVTDIAGGHRVTITDAEGTQSFDVLDGSGAPAFYGVCNSSYGSLTKVVTCDGFELVEGARIIVTFTASSDTGITTGQLKLNVNSTGAKNIKYRNSIATFYSYSDRFCDYKTCEFVYDGTYYIVVGDFDTNTTYLNLTKSAIDTGTDVTGRLISAKVLHDALEESGGGVTVDDALSTTSENPVQNKVITGELNDVKADLSQLQESIFYVTPEQFGAVGDGVTDDSQAVQDACDAGYAVYFASGKTYYLASTVTIDHDCHLFGGENTIIKTLKPSGGSYYNAFTITGSLKKTTTLTTDYTSDGNTDNSGNRFTLSDMTDINIGDIMVITATDQYYSVARSYYYLGATLLVSEIYDGHLYTADLMPWNIENTENVSVEIYNAPTAIIEDLSFESIYDGVGSYTYFVSLEYCKDSIIRNCNMTQMPNGIQIYFSVNVLIDGVELSKAKYDNAITNDSYGIAIISSTNTIVQRVIAVCAQHCITTGGSIPVLNTYIRNCNLVSECRMPAIGMHENAYNTVVEDCIVFGTSFAGTVSVNRCQFRTNKRVNAPSVFVYNGTDNPDYATLKVTNCIFDQNTIQLNRPTPQDPIRAFECVFSDIVFEDCVGGYLYFVNDSNAYITSNIVERLVLRRWKNCYAIMTNTNKSWATIKYMEVDDCEFVREDVWLNQNSGGWDNSGIERIYRHGNYHENKQLFVNSSKFGGRYVLPINTSIALSSAENDTHYIVCGKNIASNNASDYSCGFFTATVGQQIVFTPASVYSSSLSNDSNGNLVFSQPTNYSGEGAIFSKCMTFAPKGSVVRASCTLKDTGTVSGQRYRLYIIQVSCKTGLIIQNTTSSAVYPSVDGTSLSYQYGVSEDAMIIALLNAATAVAGSITTIEDYVIEICPQSMLSVPLQYTEYDGTSCDGNGTLLSVEGNNYIMSSATDFNAYFKVDYIANPAWKSQNASGVSF